MTLPPGASPALACILLAIDLAATVEDLAEWWRAHQPALRHLPSAERALAVAAKDRRKLQLATPRANPPPAHLPTVRASAPSGQGWLV